MTLNLYRISALLIVLFSASIISCKNSSEPPETDVVKNVEKLSVHITTNIQKFLDYAEDNKSQLNDSMRLNGLALVAKAYESNGNQSLWTDEGTWIPAADSLFYGIENSRLYGLFPADYHFKEIAGIRRNLLADTLLKRDASLWARADLLLTDAYLEMARHLKLGRISRDSLTLRKDSLYDDQFFLKSLNAAQSTNRVIQTLSSLEPQWPEYKQIREGIKSFLDSADFRPYTYIEYPSKDSVALSNMVAKRLAEEGLLASASASDTAAVSNAIRAYQAKKEVKVTGKLSDGLVRLLNNTDAEKFKRVAITLDRYKLMPDAEPETYVFVNLPAYTLYVYDNDTISFTSKVIVGTPRTSTPLLTSAISNFITFPQWTVPYSIIFRDMLPRIQKNVDYLAQQNLMIVDNNDNVIDPNTVDWSKMSSKHFPYLIRQKQGDDNSLGVMKFNFVNKYSVYLHDTNARGLFARSARALSHGCVRVQKWDELSRFLVRGDTTRFPPDTLAAWIGRQEKHQVTGFPKVPLYIRYFTVEGKDGHLNFYSDIYGYDRLDRNKYFANRTVI